VESEEQLRELEEKYEGYEVYDSTGEKIGKVDAIFVDETDREEYVGVKMGLFGLSGTTLIPAEITRLNEQERTIEVSESKDHVKDAPTYSDEDEITLEFEDRIRDHFGLESLKPSVERGTYGPYAGTATGLTSAEGGIGIDEDSRRRESYRDRKDMDPSGSTVGLTDAAGATPLAGTSDSQTGDRGRERDEAQREAYLKGYRQGLREGLGRAEATTRGMESGERGFEQGGTRDQFRGTVGPADETGDTLRRSDESEEREESGLTRVWRRMRR
jgi:hypothetical protein